MRVRVTLTVGFAGARYEEILLIPEEEWEACETDEEREALRYEYWADWANAFIEGTMEVVEEYH